MKILAFDTSTSACSVALYNEERVYELHEVAPKKHAQLILPMIRDLLSDAYLSLNDLDAIAYGCGPGSFTGTRIAISVAQSIGFAIKKPLIPISSLAIMAQTVLLDQISLSSTDIYESNSIFLVAMDARMNQIYWAIYKPNTHNLVELIGKEELALPDEVIIPEDAKICGIGDGWKIYWEKLMMHKRNKSIVIYASQLPSAKALLQLAKIKFSRGEWLDAINATQVYLKRDEG